MLYSDLTGEEKITQLKIERLTSFINIVAKSGQVDLSSVIRQLAELSGVENSDLVVPGAHAETQT